MNRSRQRDLITEYLKSTKSHPTADEVYQAVRLKEPNISLGTVYRNLNLLAEKEMILKLHMDDGIDHFDADTSEHYHFLCKECGRVSDLPFKLPLTLTETISEKSQGYPGEINGFMVYLYGRCNKCLQKNKVE